MATFSKCAAYSGNQIKPDSYLLLADDSHLMPNLISAHLKKYIAKNDVMWGALKVALS